MTKYILDALSPCMQYTITVLICLFFIEVVKICILWNNRFSSLYQEPAIIFIDKSLFLFLRDGYILVFTVRTLGYYRVKGLKHKYIIWKRI